MPKSKPSASSIYGVETEHTRLKRRIYHVSMLIGISEKFSLLVSLFEVFIKLSEVLKIMFRCKRL
jgi:hypothetical protein